MMHRARSSIVEVPYCFSRSSVKFQGHTALKIVEFDPKWAFPDCNSSLKSPMAMKCCTKLETAKERCPIVFQGHLSNFKVTRYETSPILTQIGRFWTIGQSQLSNPSDLPCSLSSFFWIYWGLVHFSSPVLLYLFLVFDWQNLFVRLLCSLRFFLGCSCWICLFLFLTASAFFPCCVCRLAGCFCFFLLQLFLLTASAFWVSVSPLLVWFCLACHWSGILVWLWGQI